MTRTPVEERRRALLAAAFRVVAADGLAGASTRAIVAEAGMSLASFHYAFESRDELLGLLITEVNAHEERAVAPEDLTGLTLQDLIRQGLRGYFEHLRANPTHEQAMLELTQYALRERTELARDQYAAYTRIAMASLEVGADLTGCVWTVPLQTVARLLVTLTDGLTMTWLVDRDDDLALSTIDAAASAVASLASAEMVST